MPSKEKKIVFTIIGIMVVILLIVVIVKSASKPKEDAQENNVVANEEKYVSTLSDGTKLNNSDDLNNKHTYKGVEISNIQFTSQNGNSILLADIKNTGSTAFDTEEARLVLLGENGEVLREIAVYLPSLEVGETKQINSIVTADVVNVKDFRIEAK